MVAINSEFLIVSLVEPAPENLTPWLLYFTRIFSFQNKPKPTQVDSTIQVVSDLYENNNVYEPSTKPPTNYKAPSLPFKLPVQINDALEPERVKDFIEDDAINTEDDEYEYVDHGVITDDRVSTTEETNGQEMILDDMIIKSVEEALAIRVPNDPMIRHRDTDPNAKKAYTASNEVSNYLRVLH